MLTNILNYSSGLFTTKIMLVYIKYHMFNLCQLCRQLHTIFIRNVFMNTINKYIIPCLLQCSHTTAYDISVCQRMVIRSHTQIDLRCTLGMRRVHVRSKYSDRFKKCSECERIAYTLLIQCTLTICMSRRLRQIYADYVTYTCACVMHALLIRLHTLRIR